MPVMSKPDKDTAESRRSQNKRHDGVPLDHRVRRSEAPEEAVLATGSSPDQATAETLPRFETASNCMGTPAGLQLEAHMYQLANTVHQLQADIQHFKTRLFDAERDTARVKGFVTELRSNLGSRAARILTASAGIDQAVGGLGNVAEALDGNDIIGKLLALQSKLQGIREEIASNVEEMAEYLERSLAGFTDS